jgi:DNA-binding response OmpR family regulator
MKKILIVENDPAIQSLVALILENEGYMVEGTLHIPASEIAMKRPDLILLDEWINKREGHMLCKEIKAIENLRHIPVIIFSTASDIIDIVKNCGADGYVPKPFELDELVREIKKHLPLTAKREMA